MPTTKSKIKYATGRMSNKDIEFIRQNLNRLSIEQIQARLNPKRHVDQIAREITRIKEAVGLPELSKKAPTLSVAERLRNREEWKKWQKQFSEEELRQFTAKYVELMAQFQAVTSTEDMQIISLITNEILHDRVLVSKQNITHDLALSRELLDQAHVERSELKNTKTEKGQDQLSSLIDLIDKLHVDIETYKAQDKELTGELKIYQERMDKAFQSLKATRDQRFKVSENSDKNFLGLLTLLGNESEQMRVSEEMIMSYLATELEKVRLGRLHKYEDGNWDRPLLNDETVLLEDDDEDDESSEGEGVSSSVGPCFVDILVQGGQIELPEVE